MSRKYKRVTTDIDPERGNAVTIYREDVAPLVKTLPTEVTAPIFDAFMRWHCNVAVPEIKDALARAILEQFKERQREAVKAYISICNSRTRPAPTDGERQVETSGDKSLNKRSIKNEVNVNETSVLYGGEATPPDGSTPTASPSAAIGKEDVIWARQTMARWATAPNFVLAFDPKEEPKHKKGDDSLIDERAKNHLDRIHEQLDSRRIEDTWFMVSKKERNDCIEEKWDDYSTLEVIKKTMGDDAEYDDALREAWRKYRDTLGSTFANAVWSFWIEHLIGSLPATDKEGQPTNPRKLLLGRLKNLARAKAILAQYDSERKPRT